MIGAAALTNETSAADWTSEEERARQLGFDPSSYIEMPQTYDNDVRCTIASLTLILLALSSI